MTDLYLIFFIVGLVLFTGIVVYSVLQKRRHQAPPRKDYVDPLFAELEESKGRVSASQATPAQGRSKPSKAISKTSRAQAALNKAVKKKQTRSEPSAAQPDSTAEAMKKREQRSKLRAPLIKPKEPKIQKSAAAEPVLQDAPTPEPESAETAPKPVVEQGSKVVMDLVAKIKNPAPIEQQDLLLIFRRHDFKFHRKVHIYGLNELTDMWRDIEFELPSARFTELGVSIQLADRDGAMSQKEAHGFQQMVLEFTDTYDAPFEFSMDIDSALKQAQSLDQMGRRYDSMAVLNVVPKSKSGFRMADIESCARDLMMSTDKNGIFMKTKGHKNQQTILYRLACTDGSGHFGVSNSTMAPVHDLVVYMNVPATPDPERVFQEMVKDANSLSTWLEGKVVDRHGRVMTQRSYSVLMQQVSDIAFSMQQDGLTPGDAIAKKLF